MPRRAELPKTAKVSRISMKHSQRSVLVSGRKLQLSTSPIRVRITNWKSARAPQKILVTGPKLKKLAASCEVDCNRLLSILKTFNIKKRSGPGWWKSFQVALAEALQSAEVKQLRQRISDYQRGMILQFCSASK